MREKMRTLSNADVATEITLDKLIASVLDKKVVRNTEKA